jgi:hypothetical protein
LPSIYVVNLIVASMKRRVIMSDKVSNERTSGDSHDAKRCSERLERRAILRASGWRDEEESEAPFEPPDNAIPSSLEEAATRAQPKEDRKQETTSNDIGLQLEAHLNEEP